MDKYDILGLIGEGSFGRVYKAQKKQDKSEIVALKLISKCGRSQSEITCLRQECDIQKYLKHPNIIRMLDSFETEFEIVVVTEYASRDLHQLLAEKCYFSEERASTIIYDLVSALYYLHSNRVLHRDLKPSNVLVGSDGIAKLCDFGLARHMGGTTQVLTSIKGTPLYMAPELIHASPYDHNADIWSMGCITYEMLVGTPPFITKSILHLVQLIKYREIVWPQFLSPNCLSFLKGILKKEPRERLTWPALLEHPFVAGKVRVVQSSTSPSLNPPSTPSKSDANEKPNDSSKNNQEKAIWDQNESGQEEWLGAEEWVAFLDQCAVEAVTAGDWPAEPALISMVARALSSANPSVLTAVSRLLSLPFAVEDSPQRLQHTVQVYCECGIAGLLVAASDNAAEMTLMLALRLAASSREARSQITAAARPGSLGSALTQGGPLAATVLALLTLLLTDDDSAPLQLVLRTFSLIEHPEMLMRRLVMGSGSGGGVRWRAVALLAEVARRSASLAAALAPPRLVADIEALVYDSDHALRQVAEGFLINMKNSKVS